MKSVLRSNFQETWTAMIRPGNVTAASVRTTQRTAAMSPASSLILSLALRVISRAALLEEISALSYQKGTACNPHSGNGEGKALLSASRNGVISLVSCTVNVFDIRACDSTLTLLKAKQGLVATTILVAGGDGTFIWLVSKLRNFGIETDDSSLRFGIIPVGTGNDLSRVTGFGVNETNIAARLDTLLSKYFNAAAVALDIWSLNLTCDVSGSIERIKEGKAQIQMKSDGNKITDINILFCNYFSIGVEARIGFGFDKNRTSRALFNKCVYAWESVKKSFKRNPRLKDIMANLKIDNSLVVRPSDIKNNPSSIIFQNVPSFASGSNIWLGATQFALLPNVIDERIFMQQNQDFGDGKIELLTVGGITQLALAKMAVPGAAKRLYQGEGPHRLEFKEKLGFKTYIQTDGEYYAVKQPLCAEVKHSGKVFVLKNIKKTF